MRCLLARSWTSGGHFHRLLELAMSLPVTGSYCSLSDPPPPQIESQLHVLCVQLTQHLAYRPKTRAQKNNLVVISVTRIELSTTRLRSKITLLHHLPMKHKRQTAFEDKNKHKNTYSRQTGFFVSIRPRTIEWHHSGIHSIKLMYHNNLQ